MKYVLYLRIWSNFQQCYKIVPMLIHLKCMSINEGKSKNTYILRLYGKTAFQTTSTYTHSISTRITLLPWHQLLGVVLTRLHTSNTQILLDTTITMKCMFGHGAALCNIFSRLILVWIPVWSAFSTHIYTNHIWGATHICRLLQSVYM